MTSLIETHGQGGSGHVHLDWPYHNAFLIADPGAAWVLETSGRHWAARPVDDVANVSNGLDLRTDWTRGSADLHRVRRRSRDGGLSSADGSTSRPPTPTRPACRRTSASSAAAGPRPSSPSIRGQLAPAALRTVLRDHYDAGTVHRPRPFDDPFFFSICMHADPLDNTTASMVACLPADPAPSPRSASASAVRASARSFPCGSMRRCRRDSGSGAAIPIPPARGGACGPCSTWSSATSPRHGPAVRARWDAFEAALWQDAAEVERAAERQDAPARRALLGAFSETAVDRWLAELDAVSAAIR